MIKVKIIINLYACLKTAKTTPHVPSPSSSTTNASTHSSNFPPPPPSANPLSPSPPQLPTPSSSKLPHFSTQVKSLTHNTQSTNPEKPNPIVPSQQHVTPFPFLLPPHPPTKSFPPRNSPTSRRVPATHLPPPSAVHQSTPPPPLSNYVSAVVTEPHSTYQSVPTRAIPSPASKTTESRSNPHRAAMYEPVDGGKAHEILARFRPIAPKPQLPPGQLSLSNTPAIHLRSRRKRSRAHLPAKRHKTTANTFLPCLGASPPERNFLALSLHQPTEKPQPLVERDLLQKLQEPKIITPRPVRPVGSSICVGPINELVPSSPPPPPKRRAEVEDEVESEKLPAVVSDYKNRVRLANSAYKELVGQPECMWLDSMPYGSDCKGFAFRPLSRRINGEVMLEFSGDSAAPPPPSLNGFSCRVKIEWACNGRKSFVDAPCDVFRVCCESKEYLFTWKFHVGEAYRTDCVS